MSGNQIALEFLKGSYEVIPAAALVRTYWPRKSLSVQFFPLGKSVWKCLLNLSLVHSAYECCIAD